jgi:EAL and modified HD-GYP domain-containing signal transduction protein
VALQTTHTADTSTIIPVHVGRQAIYDRDGVVVAYELLFRDTAQAADAASRGTYATSQVIVAAFSDFGVAKLVGNHACFVNVTREFLVGELPLPFDPAQVGIEILADVPVDTTVLAGVEALATHGFTIAVDLPQPGGSQEALLPLASYVKIDMLANDEAAVTAAVDRCAAYPHLHLIAERLETPAALDMAMSLGFQLFQGHALGRPHALKTATLAPVQPRRIQLLVELNSAEPDLNLVSTLVQSDPALSLRVLRLVNAAASGLRRTVSSIAEAVTLIGLRQLRQWVTLMVIGDTAGGDEAALAAAVTHARLCHRLAERRGIDPDSAFTTGLLNAIGKLLAVPTDVLAAELPVGSDLKAALVDHDGPLAAIIDTVHAYEHGTVTHPDVTTDMLDAITWTNTWVHTTVSPTPAGGAPAVAGKGRLSSPV